MNPLRQEKDGGREMDPKTLPNIMVRRGRARGRGSSGVALRIVVAASVWVIGSTAPAQQGQGTRGARTGAERWTATERKAARPPELWQAYMHGVVDQFAKQIKLQGLYKSDENSAALFDPDQTLETPFETVSAPSLRLDAGAVVDAAAKLPIVISSWRGKQLRLFVWMKGEDTGLASDSWGSAPGMDVLFKAADGTVLAAAPAYMKTLGTFPWHCYYQDVLMPTTEALEGVYVRFHNRGAGTAWFSGLSWEAIGFPNAYTNEEKQDPVTGSLAPNPKFDELPAHLRWGKARRYDWSFFRGPAGGAPGIGFDLTTVAGFRDYYHSRAKQDRQHMCQAVRFLADWYHHGTRMQLLPPMEDGWPAGVAAVIVADQDPETGFWGLEGAPRSMAVTWSLVDGLFGARRIRRPDREDVPMPWLSLGVPLPHPDRIIDTVLDMQQRTGNGSSQNPQRQAWSMAAYDYVADEETRAAGPDTCLAATSNAIELLRIAVRYTDPPRYEEVYTAVRAAVGAVLDKCVTTNALWKQLETDPEPTTGAFMPRIIANSMFLEGRVDERMQAPTVAVTRIRAGIWGVDWLASLPEVVAVRIYVAPAGTGPGRLSEPHLAGIIQRSRQRLAESDPIVATTMMKDASRARWGTNWEPMGAYTYTSFKLDRMIGFPAVKEAGNVLELELPDPARAEVYVAAVNRYGELSRPTLVQELTPPRPAGTTGAATAVPAANP